MKTLLLNGSPRKNGATSTMLTYIQNKIQGEIMPVDTYHTSISPCIDCRHCWTHPNCAIQDGMEEVYQFINEADNIILASPIYFGEVTGALLNFASRLQYFWTAKQFRNAPVLKDKLRTGAVILVDGGDGYMETAYAMGKRLLRVMGADCNKLIYYSGTDHPEKANPMDHEEIVQSADELIALCNQQR